MADPTGIIDAEAAHSLREDLQSYPDADPRDLGPKDVTVLANFYNSDLFAFATDIFGYEDLDPDLHGQFASWLMQWGKVQVVRDGEKIWLPYEEVGMAEEILLDFRRLMTQIPREHFKTSLGTIANALWQICREPNKPVAIFNERLDNVAKKALKSIKDVVSSSVLFQSIYPDLLPPGISRKDREAGKSTPRWWKWNDLELDFQGKRLAEAEASISAHGVEGATTGGHWPKLILDDLISVKHKQSAAEMERAREWIKTHTSLMRPAERSMAYVNCTPWTYTDIYRDLLRDYGYLLYRRSALEDSDGKPDIARGESIFPAKLSTKILRRMYDRDPFTFASQYQCIPKAGHETSFSTEWLRYGRCNPTDPKAQFVIERESFDPEISGVTTASDDRPSRSIALHSLNREILIDPAPTEESERRREPHARTAMLVEGIDPWGRRYLLETWAGRLDYADVIAKLFELADRWSVTRCHIEEVNFSNAYRHWVRREQQPDGRFAGIPLTACALKPSRRDKDARILARQADWRAGLYYVNRDYCDDFLVEYAEYPNSETKDLMDCMGYDKDPGVLSRPSTITEIEADLYYSQRLTYPYTTRDPITGY